MIYSIYKNNEGNNMDYQDKWFKNTKKKLINWINGDYWDLIELNDLQLTTVSYITNAKKFDDLPYGLRIDFMDNVVKNIDKKLKAVKKECKKHKRKQDSESEDLIIL